MGIGGAEGTRTPASKADVKPFAIIPVRGMARSDVRRAQKQALTVVGQHDSFIGGFSSSVALHFANKYKSKGAKRGIG